MNGCRRSPCDVEIKIKYFPNDTVEIFGSTSDHGPNFMENNKPSRFMWKEVIDYFKLEDKGYYSIRPDDIISYFAKRKVCKELKN